MAKKKITTILVKNNKDSGPGSLRDAVEKICKFNCIKRIILQPCVGALILLHSEITVAGNVKIINHTKKNIIIQAKNKTRLFRVIRGNYFSIVSYKKKIILSNGKSLYRGGAIHVSCAKNHLYLKNVTICNNHAEMGGGIYSSGRVKLDKCIIKSNIASSQGAGIWSAGKITCRKSFISCNKIKKIDSSSVGAGIYVDNGDCVLKCTNITNNHVAFCKEKEIGGSAGGIAVAFGNIYLYKSRVEKNSAFNSGGIQQGIGNVSLDHSSSSYNESFNSNKGAVGGGGIVITKGDVYLFKSKISHNLTRGMFSGGIVSVTGDVDCYHSLIKKNTNRGPGGGIAMNFGNVTVRKTKVCKNTGASLGGAIVSFAPSRIISITKHCKIYKNTLTDAQTIGQTIQVFLSVLSSHAKNLISQSKRNEGEGGKKLIAAIPEILYQLKKIHEHLLQLTKIHPLDHLIGGGAVATMLDTFVDVKNSKIKKNFCGKKVIEGEKFLVANGGGFFNFSGELKIKKSSITYNKTLTDGGGVWSRGKFYRKKTIIKHNKPNNVILFKPKVEKELVSFPFPLFGFEFDFEIPSLFQIKKFNKYIKFNSKIS